MIIWLVLLYTQTATIQVLIGKFVNYSKQTVHCPTFNPNSYRFTIQVNTCRVFINKALKHSIWTQVESRIISNYHLRSIRTHFLDRLSIIIYLLLFLVIFFIYFIVEYLLLYIYSVVRIYFDILYYTTDLLSHALVIFYKLLKHYIL